jgi:hypothetical protein
MSPFGLLRRLFAARRHDDERIPAELYAEYYGEPDADLYSSAPAGPPAPGVGGPDAEGGVAP